MSSHSRRSPRKWLRWTGDETTSDGVKATLDNHLVKINWIREKNLWVVSYASSDVPNAYAYSREFENRENAFRWSAKRCGVPLSLGFDTVR